MLALLNSPTAQRVSNDTPAAPTRDAVLDLVAALEVAARAEGRKIAGSTAADLPPLAEASARTDRARAAVALAVSALVQGGAR